MEVDNDQLRAIIKADSPTTTWEVAKKLNVVHFMVVWHLMQIGKCSISGCLMSWPQIKKIIVWNCHLLLFYATTMNHFLIWLWCATKHGFYTRTSDDQLSGCTEKRLQSTSQSQTCTKKGHGHCLVVCCWSAPLQLSESWWNHDIWEVCSANRWDAPKTAMPATGISQQKGPNYSPRQHPTICHTTNASKVERIGLRSFASSATFTWNLLPTNYHFFKHLNNFLQGKCFHNHQQEAENAFQEFVKS